MIQTLIVIAAFLFCLGLGAVIAHLIGKKKTLKRAPKVLIALVIGLVSFGLASFGYLSTYSHADSSAYESFESDVTVAVQETENGYFFDGPGDTTNAIVFYPGAKVDEAAYAPLLHRIAEHGVDCFLVHMPFHMAIFGSGSMSPLMADYEYKNWYMAGHSMGGMVAALDTSDHQGDIQGLILLAAYPTKELGNQVRLLSLYGTEDKVLNASAYEDCKKNWPDNAAEIVIEGGNHAQFGCYGEQSGDGIAQISADEQQGITADEVVKFIASDSK